MPVRVIDTSVLAAFAFGESRADEAAALLEGANLYAPDLLPYEIGSVARSKCLTRQTTEDAAFAAIETALAIPITFVKSDTRELVVLALASGLSVYDAAYLHLAQDLDCELATFDRKLQAGAKR